MIILIFFLLDLCLLFVRSISYISWVSSSLTYWRSIVTTLVHLPDIIVPLGLSPGVCTNGPIEESGVQREPPHFPDSLTETKYFPVIYF